MDDELLQAFGLSQFGGVIKRHLAPAAGFFLAEVAGPIPPGMSRFGGEPDLPQGAEWPTSRKRPLDFLLQVNLSEATPCDVERLLPSDGLLSFFYDMEEQPWGYDPNNLDGCRVVFTPANTQLVPVPSATPKYRLPERRLGFLPTATLPHPGSLAMGRMEEEAGFTEQDFERYYDFIEAFEARSYSGRPSRHRLLGHSANVQGDMQLEAQLVTHGVDCGRPSGYQSPRAQELALNADDWLLLLQLYSDDGAEVMWGDSGMLYFWLRRQDLRSLLFSKA